MNPGLKQRHINLSIKVPLVEKRTWRQTGLHAAVQRMPLRLFPLLLIIFSLPAYSLDLSLNDQNYALISSNQLFSQSRPMAALNSMQTIPLQALYPYMESVEYIEAESGVNRVFWDASRLGNGEWDSAKLVFRDGEWEIRVGRDIFSVPDRISIRGVPLETGVIRIWYEPGNDTGKELLSAALSLRGVRVDWTEVSATAQLLPVTRKDELPHLILTEDLTIIRLAEAINRSAPFAQRMSRWYASVTQENEAPATKALPYAMDAYHPETALIYLLAIDPNLFQAGSDGEFASALASILDNAAAARRSGSLLQSNTVLEDISENKAGYGLVLPGEMQPKSGDVFREISPPDNTITLLRHSYAAIPSGLNAKDDRIASLVFGDAQRLTFLPVVKASVSLPMNVWIPRFYDAYRRIGRLAVSGELSGTRAAQLIVQSTFPE